MIHDLMAPDAVGYLEGELEIAGPQEFLEFQAGFLAIIPDLHIDIVDSVSSTTDTCIHWKARGHHTGAGMGLAPTGQLVEFRGVSWLTVQNGKVVSGRDFWNKDGLMQKLATPGPAAT